MKNQWYRFAIGLLEYRKVGFLVRFVTGCWTLVLPILVLLVILLILLLVGVNHGKLALLSNAGTGLIILGNVGYIVLFDPRRRWPGTSLLDRIFRLMRFDRGVRR